MQQCLSIQNVASRSNLHVTGIKVEGFYGWFRGASLQARILIIVVQTRGAALVLMMVTNSTIDGKTVE